MGAAESKSVPAPEPSTVLDFDGLDFYAILGVSRGFSEEELKQAYRARAKETHPDKDHTNGATERFKKVLEAYETLRSPASRATYDAKIRQERTTSDSESRPQAPQNKETMPGQYHYDHKPQAQGMESTPSTPGWFSWLFSGSFGFVDPLLRYIPETYISQNRERHCPQGISAEDIVEYFELCFKNKTATPERAYVLIGNLFKCIAYDEKMWGSEVIFPTYGSEHSGWCVDTEPFTPHHAEGFYRHWLKFETKKKFDWINLYWTNHYDSRAQRQAKKENAKVHTQYREQYDGLIRGLAATLLFADPRCAQYLNTRATRRGEPVFMEVFCEQFIRRHGHPSLVQMLRNLPQWQNDSAGAGKPKQTKSQKKRQRRKKKKN